MVLAAPKLKNFLDVLFVNIVYFKDLNYVIVMIIEKHTGKVHCNQGWKTPGLLKRLFDSVKKNGFYCVFFGFEFFLKIMIYARYVFQDSKSKMFLREKDLNYNEAKLC